MPELQQLTKIPTRYVLKTTGSIGSEVFMFDSNLAISGGLCVMVPSDFSPSTANFVLDTDTDKFKGAGVCRHDSAGRYAFTVDSIVYYFDSEGKPISVNASAYRLYSCISTSNAVSASSSNSVGTVISRSGSIISTRASGGSEDTTQVTNVDSKIIIDDLNARDQFASQALRGLLSHINDPSSLSPTEISYYCEVAYKWAANMMAAAANVRASWAASSEPATTRATDVGSLDNNVEKLLNNIVYAIEQNGGGGSSDISAVVDALEEIYGGGSIGDLSNDLNALKQALKGSSDPTVAAALANINTALGTLSGLVAAVQNHTINIGTSGLGRDSNNPLYVNVGGSGGGSTVSLSRILLGGAGIADITIDGVTSRLYAPNPTTVVANPSGAASTNLTKITIGSTNYNIPTGGGGGVTDDSVYTNAIQDGAVTAAKLASNSVGSSQLQTNSVGSTNISTGAVQTSHIADGAITVDKLDVDSVDTNQLINGAVTGEKIANGEITTVHLVNNAVTGSKIATKTVTGGTNGNIALSTITSDNMAANSVGTSQLVNYAVTSTKLADGSVIPSKIDGSVNEDYIGYMSQRNLLEKLSSVLGVSISMGYNADEQEYEYYVVSEHSSAFNTSTYFYVKGWATIGSVSIQNPIFLWSAGFLRVLRDSENNVWQFLDGAPRNVLVLSDSQATTLKNGIVSLLGHMSESYGGSLQSQTTIPDVSQSITLQSDYEIWSAG